MIFTRPVRRSLFLFTTLWLAASPALATPAVLDWDPLSWVPEGNGNLSETYAVGNGNVTVTFGGNTAELDQAGAVISPAINQQNTGGLSPAQRSLYVAADYTSAAMPFVTVTLDFTGYPGGIGNFSFLVFDVDADGSTFVDELTVTALTPSGPINPTSIVTFPSNTQVNANTVVGTTTSPGTSSDGNVEFIFGDAGTPVSGITQVTIVYRNVVGGADPGFQWINIHDFAFDDPTADVALTKSAAPTAAAVGDTVTFTLQASNAGPDPAPGVAVTDQLPAGLAYLSDTGGGSYVPGTGVWTVGTLGAGASAMLSIDARVEAGGPWDNSAEVTAMLASDPNSTPGNGIAAENDQDNALVLVPVIGAAKTIVAGPVNNADGTYSLTYRITLENYGSDMLNSVQVAEDFAATFAGATAFVAGAVTSSDFTPNPGFDGVADTDLFAGTDTLAVGASGTADVAVTVTPGTALGPYDNSITASASAPSLIQTSDVSTNGADPDPDADNIPGNNSDPTPVTFAEAPEIGAAKALSAGPTNNGDGTHTLTYRVTVVNSGDVDLANLQVVDELATTFAAASGFVVDTTASSDFTVNTGFDGGADSNLLAGTDTLAAGASGTVDLTVTVTPGGTPGPYDNAATASGTSPAGAAVNDLSTSGFNPDPDGDGNPGNNSDPTPVTFTENPRVGIAKAVATGPANNGDGTYTLTYRFVLENLGDVELSGVQVSDSLAATFASASGFGVDGFTSADFTTNAGYDGSTDTNLLAGTDTLAPGASGSAEVTVTVTPGGNLGPYDNAATAAADSPSGAGVMDVSTSGADPDPDGDGDAGNNSDPTPVAFSEAPELGVAKALDAPPANNGDGSFTLSYTITIANSGDVELSELRITDDLATAFGGAVGFAVDDVTSADFAPNPGFDGNADPDLLAGTDTLAAAASGTVNVTLTVTPGGNLGPYDNRATGAARSPAGMLVTDVSTAGADPDPDGDGNPGNNSDPTPVTFSELPRIGAAKAISSGPSDNGNGTYTLAYAITIENAGNVGLDNIQVSDDLAATFAGAANFSVDDVTSAGFAINAGYDGATDTNLLAGTDALPVTMGGTVLVTVTVTPGGNLGPYDNTATASGLSPAASMVSDDSTLGADPDPDGDGDPGNNSVPTTVTFAEDPRIGVAKAVSMPPTDNGDGSFTFTYRLTIANFGNVTLTGVQVRDSLATTFAGALGFVVAGVASSDFAVNPGFDGDADTALLEGTDTLAPAASGSIDVTVSATPGSNPGPYDNTAVAEGRSPMATLAADDSVSGFDPDPDGDGDPTNNASPTTLTFVTGVDATVDITDTSVPGDTLDVTVSDADLDTDTGTVQTIVVEVVNDTTGESELVTLTETATDSGVFAGTVGTTFGTVAGTDNDGTFNTELGHTLTVTYLDELTSTGGMATRTDTGLVGNTPPVAVDDSASTPIDVAVSIPVLANDSDPNGHTLAIDSVTQPANGSVTFTPDGAVVYTPSSGFTGTDTFTYTISDGNGGFDTATVTVTVDNDTPTANADSVSTPVDTPVTIDVLANDTDPNGDPLEVVAGSPTDPANGTVVLNPDGTITYTPDSGFAGTDTFTYTITDPDGNTDTAIVTVVVSNDVPRAADDVATTPLDTPVAIDVLGNDSDPNGDALTITRVTQPANGTAAIDANGTPDPADDRVVYTPASGFTGNDAFTYTIADPDGNSAVATVIVMVRAESSILGSAWLDADIDDTFDSDEEPLEGWLVEIVRAGMVVTTVPVRGDGSYTAADLEPGSDYALRLRHPSSNAVFGVIEGITLPPGTTVIDQNLPIDPSGVVYDADTRAPIAGVTVSLEVAGALLPDVCLLPGQQSQVTGADGRYRFDILAGAAPQCPSQQLAIYEIAFTAPAGYIDAVSTLIPPTPGPLNPFGNPDPLQVAPQPGAPQSGQSTTYYLQFEIAAGAPDVINNHIPLDPVAAIADVRVTKAADRRTAVVGELVLYTVTVTNAATNALSGLTLSDLIPAGFSYVDGSARLGNGAAVAVTGSRPVRFTFDLPAATRLSLRYALRVGAGVVRGDYANTVTPLVGATPVGASASAVITVVADPDFEQTTIIGIVFDDRDGDGWQDEGETGIPGVRLATVEGLLIETDAFGRYHIAGVDGGLRERGRNFIVKVDAATLPRGTEFTTENPRVQRITEGLMNRIDFGVRLPGPGPDTACCVPLEAKLAEVFFSEGSSEIREEFLPLLGELAERLRAAGGGTLYIQGHADEAESTPGLATQRARNVYEILRGLLGTEFMREVDIRTNSGPANDNAAEPLGALPHDRPGPVAATLRRGIAALASLLVGTAHAATVPAHCTLETCRTAEGYVIEIVAPDPQRAPSPDDTRMALADDSRVDLGGTFVVPVADGGRLWVTEDPYGAEPRLAVHAPEFGASDGNFLAVPISFHVYSNYGAFVERAEVQIYHGDDIDLVEPLAVLPFKPGIFSRVDWRGQDVQRALEPGDELYFRVRVYDDKGRYDETHLNHITLLGKAEYERVAAERPDLLQPIGYETATSAARGPLDGAVLALAPPSEDVRRVRDSYTVTPHFDTRRTEIKPADQAELDRIIDIWRGNFDDIRIHVVGHTDNVRIAPQNRHEFANNQVLSEARARAVVEYLARGLGLDPSKFVSEGRAAREPVASNATAAGRAQNRRVEVAVNGIRFTRTVTGPASATLIEAATDTRVAVTETLEEASNIMAARRGEGVAARAIAAAQAPAHVLDAIYGQTTLRVQRIPVNGSRVRVHGQDLGGARPRIDGFPVPVDKGNRFAVEYLRPMGRHEFDIELVDPTGAVLERATLPVEVTGNKIFLVGLADLTISDNNVSGSIEPLAADDRYDDDLLVEGRLAFYLKGKIRGKYLITAQLDSREEELGDLFGNLTDKDPQSILRRLDPDRYYAVYGDDSTTISDTDTQGRFYVRADWDRSSATWGNFHTGITGNEFAHYNRSLYGARYQHESLNVTGKGEPRNQATLFVSEAQTAMGHSEFLGTGGSLYYLKHQDILPGSEKAWIEVRDRDSGRVRDLVTLTRGMDYEVDEIQGRIILATPLMQISRLHAPGLIKDQPLDGDDLVLLVDYEYAPSGFSPDKVTAGGRGRHWLNDDIALGATAVQENRAGDDYSLYGADIVYRPHDNTYVKLEYAESESQQAPRFLSVDGGLTFGAAPFADPSFAPAGTPGGFVTVPLPMLPPGFSVAPGLIEIPATEGAAWSIEARINSREAFASEREWVGGAWYREVDAGFSVARRGGLLDTTEYGLEMSGALSDRLQLSARASVVDREGGGQRDEDRRISLQADYALSARGAVSAEVRSVDEQLFVTGLAASDTTALLGALRYSYELTTYATVYGIGQFTLNNDSGRYDNNDLGTVGARVQIGDKTAVQGEYSAGHRGNGALLTLDHALNERHKVYGTFTQSVDRTDLRNPGTQIAVGHRSRITDQAEVYNERQFIEDRGRAGIAHVFGLDFSPRPGWSIGISVQDGGLQSGFGEIEREAGSVSAEYRSERVNWRGKVEYRNENGLSDLRQVLTTNRMDLRLSDDWRLLARVNHAETEDQTLVDRDDSAVFTEAGLGFAYRPAAAGRLNLLAKYTFLYDLPAPLQFDRSTDQRSHVVSVEGIYRLTPRWELGGKLAQRSGELRTDRDTGSWFESTTNFGALRGRYHLVRRWEALLEYRRLDVDEAGSTRAGWLVALDRHFNDHLRLGLGYNFTDFSDDLTDLDYDHKGWFINAVGKY